MGPYEEGGILIFFVSNENDLIWKRNTFGTAMYFSCLFSKYGYCMTVIQLLFYRSEENGSIKAATV